MTRPSLSARIILVMFFIQFISSCNKLEGGYVVEKWYEPKTIIISNMPVVMSNGKNTTTIMVSYVITDYEDWCVRIKGVHKDRERVETIYVTKNQYEELSIGSYYKITESGNFTDNNNQKVRR